MKKSASLLVLLLVFSFVLVSLPQIGIVNAENWNWVEVARITGDNYYSYETEPFNISSSVSVWRIVWEYEPRTDIPERQTGITINLYAGVSGDDKLIEISRMGIYNGNEDTRYFHEQGVFRLKISSNTQNFTVRIEQSMGYIPEPPSDNWVEVTRFIGTKGFTTDVFVCDHIEWRIRWEFDPGHWHFADLHTLQVTTYKEGESNKYFNQIREPPNGNLNGVELLNQSGTFYLEISTGLIDSYTIIVEENIDSIPEDPSWNTIYIRSDGTVKGTDKIQIDGDVYTFIDNIVNQSIVVEKDNIVVDGAGYTLQGNRNGTDVGISLISITNVTIKSVEIKNFSVGISLYNSFRNTISGNTMASNILGIEFWAESNYNTISENTITANEDGMFIYGSSNNITGNIITVNSGHGIDFYGSSNNITGNYIVKNGVGVYVNANFPFVGSQNNSIYRNTFINNTKQVGDILWEGPFGVISVNIWDNGYPSGGNYWSDYEDRYPDAEEIDESGIWDTPYEIDENNQDNYPIVPEFPSWIILPLFVIATLVVLIYRKRIIKERIVH